MNSEPSSRPGLSDSGPPPGARPSPELSRERLAASINPLRFAIVDSLTYRAAGAAELAAVTGAPITAIRYHLRRLRQAGLIEAAGIARSEGAKERLYIANPRNYVLRRSDTANLKAERLDKAQARLLRVMFREAIEAVEAGTFSRRDEFGRIFFPIILDHRGWEESALIHDQLTELTFAVNEQCAMRLGDSGSAAFPATMTIFFYEDLANPERSRGTPSASTGRDPKAQPRLMDGLVSTTADPLRLAIVLKLVVRPASATELAEELEVPLEKIRYQVKKLRRIGLVGTHGQRRRRGVAEHIYVVDPRDSVVQVEEMHHYPPERRRRGDPMMVRSIFREVTAAARAGSFHGREDSGLVRIPLALDDQGFRDVAELLRGALERLFEAREHSLERLQTSGDLPRLGASVLLFFERPRSDSSHQS